MIGQRVTGTIWVVTYRYMSPPEGSTSHTAPVQGRTMVITADPTGADLLDVVRMVILGPRAVPAHAFTIIVAERGADIDGLALLPAEDLGWHSHFAADSALLHLAGRQAASSCDLTKRLAAAELELNALRLVASRIAADPTLTPCFAELLEAAKAAHERGAELLDAPAAPTIAGLT